MQQAERTPQAGPCLDANRTAATLAAMAHRVCPWWMGYLLACPLRRWVHDPAAIVGPFVSEGMVVLEPGPGMGFFTLELARRVGPKGRVIAVDVQPKMIEGLVRRAKKAGLAGRIDARQPRGEHLGIEDYLGKVDFALAFAMIHEVPRPEVLFADIRNALKAGGQLLFAEPAGHVRAEAFERSLELASNAGLVLRSRPVIRRSHAAVLERGQPA
jgi:SAM-dependent methyltransferase